MLRGEEGHQDRAYIVREGDAVLLYIDQRRRRVVKVEKGKRFNSDKGYIYLDELIGKRIGDEVTLSTGAKARILKPLMTDYLDTIRRVTQVIYPKDIGLIIVMSGIGPGSRVLEGGVGTGFLTAFLAYIVGKEGKVYAYEIREDFAKVARKNLERLGLLDRVELHIGDVRTDVKERGLDAAFLDIPDPWEALETVRKALKPSSPVISFVPTVNQVIKLLRKLSTMDNIIDVKVVDLMMREYNPDPEALRPKSVSVTHTGYIVFFRVV